MDITGADFTYQIWPPSLFGIYFRSCISFRYISFLDIRLTRPAGARPQRCLAPWRAVRTSSGLGIVLTVNGFRLHHAYDVNDKAQI